jgi:uncharacterized protein YbbK (DUF523 family)
VKTRPRVGISSCLLGEKVRYDGGDKLEPVIPAALGPLVELVPVCPEVEAGLGVPREPVELVAGGARARVLGVESGADHTAALERATAARLRELAALGLGGYVLKSRSPSCGLDVPVFGAHGRGRRDAGGECDDPDRHAAARGPGLFAAALLRAFPDLPVIEEGALRDPEARAAFIRRVMERHERAVGS